MIMKMDDEPSGWTLAGVGCLVILAYLVFWGLLLLGACLIVKAVFF